MFRKRWIIALFILWTLAAGQLAQGHAREEERVAQVFARVGEEAQTSVVEYYGVYEKDFLNHSERESFLRKIAGELGITDHIEVSETSEEGREETRLCKDGSKADTVLRFLTSSAEGGTRQYMIVNLTMQGGMDQACAYRDKLKEILDPYMEDSRSSANVIGSYRGELSLEERNQIADTFFEQVDAKIVSENRDMNLYTIYGYTPWITEYEMQEEEPFNVNIAMHYHEGEDRTYVYAAVPAVGLDY